MESLVLSIVAKYLKDYVNNFRKEQISVNFLRGQGVIRDLDVNVDAINELFIQPQFPSIKVSKLLINTLSVNAPIMSLKTKPIVVFIDELFIEIVEVPECERKRKSDTLMSSPSKGTKEKKDKPVKYGFLDRVGDSLSFEINRISLAFRTLGKLKTEEIGLWTPPVFLVELLGNRFFCTNQNGIETELDSCFRVRQTKRPMLFIYKKLQSKRIRIHLVNSLVWPRVREDIINGWSSKESFHTIRRRYGEPRGGYISFQLIENTAIDIQMCFRKRIDNNCLLGIEVAIVIGAIRQSFRQKCLSALLHFVQGIQSCVIRSDMILQAMVSSDDASSTSSTSTDGDLRQRVKLNREQLGLGKEESASLDMLEAEAFGSVASVANAAQSAYDDSRIGEGWQRSSLNSDEDPPHIRLVVSTQIDEIIITFPFDGMQREWTVDQLGDWEKDFVSESDSEDDNDDDSIVGADTEEESKKEKQEKGSPSNIRRHRRAHKEYLHGIILSVSGLVHSNIWPEHASYTETVSQVTIKHVSLHEYRGINKSCIFRTTKPLDSDGRPLVVNLLPRGVKENSLGDPEYLPGTSIIVKTDSCWPSLPTPDRNGNTTNTEVHICAVDVSIRLPILLEMATFFSVAVDPRWESCQWGEGMDQMISKGEVKTIDMFPSGSSSIAVVVNGIHAAYFPVQLDIAEENPKQQFQDAYVSLDSLPARPKEEKKSSWKGVSSLQSSQINLDIDLLTVQCKHTLDATFLAGVVPGRTQQTTVTNQKQKDLTEALPWQKFSSTLPLLSPRLEATLSAIRISVVTDELDRVYVAERPMGDASPHFKNIIKPFTLSVFTSLDPIPERIPDIMEGLDELFGTKTNLNSSSLFAAACPVQSRLFYWPRCPYCIETTYIGIEDFTIDMTLLDVVYLSKTIDSIRDQIKELDVVGWFFTLFPAAGRKRKFTSNTTTSLHVGVPKEVSAERSALSSLARVVLESAANEVWMIKVFNTRASVLQSTQIRSVSTDDGSVQDQEIVGLIAKSASVVYEKESKFNRHHSDKDIVRLLDTSLSSKVKSDAVLPMLVRGECGGVAMSVSGRPILFLNVDDIEGIVFRACSSNICPSKWLSHAPAVLFCYDTRPSLLSTVSASAYAMPNIDNLAEFDLNPSGSISALVIVEVASGGCVVLQPRSILLVLQGCVSELLKGVGSVDTQCTHWWQDSVFGFFRTHLDQLIGGDSRKGVIVQVTRQQLVKVSKTVDPVQLSFIANNVRVAIIDVLDDQLRNDGNSQAVAVIAPTSAKETRDGESPLFFHKMPTSTYTKQQQQQRLMSSCLLLTLQEGTAVGRLRSGEQPIVALKIHSSIQVQLIQFNAVADTSLVLSQTTAKLRELLSLTCSDITSPFAVSLNLLRAGINPTAVKSNLTATDFASLIDYGLADRSWAILYQLVNLAKEMQSLILNFWNTVEHSVSAHQARALITASCSDTLQHQLQVEDREEEDQQQSQPHQGDEDVGAVDHIVRNIDGRSYSSISGTSDIVLHLLGSSTLSNGISSSSASASSSSTSSSSSANQDEIQQEKLHTYRTKHLRHLSVSLSRGLLTGYSQTKSLQDLLFSSASVLDNALKGVFGVCIELEDIVARARFAASLSSNVSPTYCSWVKRTIGFSKFDRTVSNFKSWAVLINNSIYFLQQPYSTNVDLALQLDLLSVIDPDRDNEDGTKPATPFGGKSSLSTILIFSHESGSLYLECESMDNKAMWVDALSSWIINSSLSGQTSYHHSKSKSISKSIRKSFASFGTSIAGGSSSKGVSNEDADITKLDSKSKSVGFKSAAKGMMKAFSLASSSFGSTTTTPVSKPKSVTINTSEQTQSSSTPLATVAFSADNDVRESVSVGDNASDSGISSASTSVPPTISNISFSDALKLQSSLAENGKGTRAEQSNSYAEGGDDNSVPTSLNSMGAAAGGNVLAQLDSLRQPIQQYKSFLETAAQVSSTELQESSQVMKQVLSESGASLMAAAAIDMLSQELLAEQIELERRRVRSIAVLSQLLREEKEKNASLVQRWSQAKSLQVELESVLQACTMQHIGTVQAMSKQFDDLQEQVRLHRKQESATASGYSTRDKDTTASFQELVCHLTKSIGEMEQSLKAAREKEKMMSEEIRSYANESEFVRKSEKHLYKLIQEKQQSYVDSMAQQRQQLEAEQRRNAALEAENRELRARLNAMSMLVKDQLS